MSQDKLRCIPFFAWALATAAAIAASSVPSASAVHPDSAAFLPTPEARTSAAPPSNHPAPSSVAPGPADDAKALLAEGRYEEAEAVARRALVAAEARSGRASIEAAGALDALVEALWRGGKATIPEAKALADRALSIREHVLGTDDPAVAGSLANLATLLYLEGDFKGARQPWERSLAIREKSLGAEHSETAASLYGLGNLLLKMAEFAGAEAMLQGSLTIREKTLGPEHPDVAETLVSLAYLSYKKGKFLAASPLYERALAIQEKSLGPRHPVTALTLRRLGHLLLVTGDLDGSKRNLERALTIQEEKLRPGHPDTGVTVGFLASMYYTAGDLKQARPLFEQSLEIQEKALGPEHADLAGPMNNFALFLWRAGDYAASKTLLERALANWEGAYGPEHPDVSQALNNLASLLTTMGDFDAAKPLLQRTLAIRQKALGPDHPDLAVALMGLANLAWIEGEYKEAGELYERSLAIREKAFGPEFREVAGSLVGLANVLKDEGDYAGARPLYERALAIREKAQGPETPEAAHVLSALGALHLKTGETAAARAALERSLAIREKVLGSGHIEVASNLVYLGTILRLSGDLAGSRILLERALAIHEKVRGPDHPDVAFVLAELAQLAWGAGDAAAAMPLLERAIAINAGVFGDTIPSIADCLALQAEVLSVLGRKTEALDSALRAEATGFAHLRLTLRALPERQALRYAAVRASGLDHALSLAAEGLETAQRERVFDALIRSRAAVLDEMAARRRAIVASRNPKIAVLAKDLARTSRRLANLQLVGPGGLSLESYRRLVDDARREKERTERTLTEQGGGTQAEERSRAGLREVSAAMPADSALVAYARYRPKSPRRTEEAADEGNAGAPRGLARGEAGAQPGLAKGEEGAPRGLAKTEEGEPDARYLAFVLRGSGHGVDVVPLGDAGAIEPLVARWTEVASRLTDSTGTRRTDQEESCREAGEGLRRKVWDPLARRLSGAKRVMVVTDGALHLVNLAALPTDPGRYLVESGPLLQYISAERDLIRSKQLTQRKGEGLLSLGGPSYDDAPPLIPPEPAPHAQAASAQLPSAQLPSARLPSARLTIAQPATTQMSSTHVSSASGRASGLSVYRGASSSCAGFKAMHFEPLPSSVREAERVAELWRTALGPGQARDGGAVPRTRKERSDVALLLGRSASEAAFKEMAPGRRVLHLATHGFFLGGRCASSTDLLRGVGGLAISQVVDNAPPNVENPLVLSGLALAGANHRNAVRHDEEDGILTAEEIAAMDLSGVEWAVLSACETGVGRVQNGEGVLGLRRAFQVAGAGTLIMSLWPVGDEAAFQWMDALYEARLIKKLGTSEAVRNATLKVLKSRRARGESTLPGYWAGFVASGEWR